MIIYLVIIYLMFNERLICSTVFNFYKKQSKHKYIFTISPRQILLSEFMSIHFILQTYNSTDFHAIYFTS